VAQMAKRLEHKILVTPEDFKPINENYKVIGAFNPAAVRFGDEICLLVRVAEAPIEERDNYFSSPRVTFGKDGEFNIKTEWFPIRPNHDGDNRKFWSNSRHSRLAFLSHLRLVKLDKTGFNVTFIDDKPTFYPVDENEEFGVEDPRLTKIDGRYYFTYVAVSRAMGVCTALASTADFESYTRHGVIFCMENKDIVLLPEKIKGKYVAYHRPSGGMRFSPMAMSIAYSTDLIHWGEHAPLLSTREGSWDDNKMGAGPPPIKIPEGWLEIYHGVSIEGENDPVGVYRAGAALFNLNDPGKLIARSNMPILEPVEKHEAKGFVGNVIFPTGIVVDETGDNIILFSGGADTVVTATKLSLKEVVDSMRAA